MTDKLNRRGTSPDLPWWSGRPAGVGWRLNQQTLAVGNNLHIVHTKRKRFWEDQHADNQTNTIHTKPENKPSSIDPLAHRHHQPPRFRPNCLCLFSFSFNLFIKFKLFLYFKSNSFDSTNYKWYVYFIRKNARNSNMTSTFQIEQMV